MDRIPYHALGSITHQLFPLDKNILLIEILREVMLSTGILFYTSFVFST